MSDVGKDLCIDVYIVFTFVVGAVVYESGESAKRVKERKNLRYEPSCSSNDLIFDTFIMKYLESFGRRAD